MNLSFHGSGAADGIHGGCRGGCPFGQEVQVYHWGLQDADVILPLTSQLGAVAHLLLKFFSPKMLHAFSGRILWLPPHSECREGNIGLDLSTPELAIWKSTRALELTAVFPGDSLWPLLTREKWYCPPGFMIYIPVCWNQHAKLQRNLFHQIQLPILSASSWMAFKGLWEAGKGCLVFHGGILPFLAFLCFNFFLLKWQESLHVVVSSSHIYFHLRSARYWANLHFSSGLQTQ